MANDFDRVAGELEPKKLLSKLEGAMTKATLLGLRASQPRTPVRTGNLRRSETTRVEDSGRRGFVGTNVEYAPFVHARVPFFAQGIEDAKPAIVQLFEDAGQAFLDKAAS